jgi:hypothetical protein
MSRAFYILPNKLNRKYSIWEKFSVLFGDTYKKNNIIRIKPYALFIKFNKNGFTRDNPYLIFRFWENKWVNLKHERLFYEKDGLCFKSDEIKRQYNNNKFLYCRKRVG